MLTISTEPWQKYAFTGNFLLCIKVGFVVIKQPKLLSALACAFYWSSLEDGTSGLVAGSRDSEEHA